MILTNLLTTYTMETLYQLNHLNGNKYHATANRKPKLKLKTKEMILLRKRRRLIEQTLIKESTEKTNAMMEDPIGSLRSLMQDLAQMAHLISIGPLEIEILNQMVPQIPNPVLLAGLQLLLMQEHPLQSLQVHNPYRHNLLHKPLTLLFQINTLGDPQEDQLMLKLL